MPLITHWSLSLEVDQVLRAQGADPDALRARRPALVEIAQKALEEGLPLLEPAVLYDEMNVQELRHERLYLRGNGSELNRAYLSGPLVASHLGGAERVAAVVCTIGERLEKLASEAMQSDPLRGLAIDAVGSAAAEALGNSACRYFEDLAQKSGWGASLPLSPGMVEWPVTEGQPQIFALLKDEQSRQSEFRVSLTNDHVMLPYKSVSFVIGLGPQVDKQGRTCDFCAMKDTCRYQGHYAHL